MNIKIKKWARIVLVITTVFMAACNKTEQVPQGEKAYEFSLNDLNGKTYSLTDFKGKVVILDFWDTWCPPCKAEIPDFIDLHNEYKDQGFVMIGAAIGRQGENAVRQFIRDYKIPYLNLMANMETIQGYGSFNSIPTTFVIDRQGYIYKKYTGVVSKETFEEDIKTLLKS